VDDLPQTIQLEELRREQKNDEECQQLLEHSLVTPGSPIYVNMDGVLVRKAPLDGVEQIIVSQSLTPPGAFSTICGTPGHGKNVSIDAFSFLLARSIHRCGGSCQELPCLLTE
jgi:hypothetical protein